MSESLPTPEIVPNIVPDIVAEKTGLNKYVVFGVGLLAIAGLL